MDPITRNEQFLAAAGGQSVELPTPITRKEKFLAKAAGVSVETPDPITREEQFINAISGGGGGDITTQSLSVSENGTYTAPSGKAYTPVTVSVSNTYAAGDEGKVVQNGELVAQTSLTVTENNTYDTTTKNSVTVNVPGESGQLTLLSEINVSENVRSVAISFLEAYSNYDYLLLLHDVSLSAPDYIYYSTTDTSGGIYMQQKQTISGIAYVANDRNGRWRFYASASLSLTNQSTKNDLQSGEILYMYTYTASKLILSGSSLRIYGGMYADL